MKAVVLCSGLATRMGGTIKPLIKVAGREIIYRTLKILQDNGVDEFIIIANKINKNALTKFLEENGFKFKIVVNEQPERGSGYSFYLSKDFVNGRFVLIMGDHIFEEDFIRNALKLDGLICDCDSKFVNVEEATKVLVKNGRVTDIGKHLNNFTCIDTGFFILTKDIFTIAEKLIKEKKVVELSEIIKEAKVNVNTLNGYFWMDIDTPEDVKRAKKIIVRKSVKKGEDGFISRHLNRKISPLISEKLIDRIDPIHATIMSFLVGILSSLVVFYSIPLSGIIYQISSILNGVDGEIARAAMKTSKTGGWLDSTLDRYVDFLFLTCLAVNSLVNYEWILALFAIFGSFMISYTTERYRAEFKESFYKRHRPVVFGKRDERIFLIMLFCLLSPWVDIFYLFVVIAIVTNLRVVESILRVILLKR